MKNLKIYFKDGRIYLFERVLQIFCIEGDLSFKHINAVGEKIISYFSLEDISFFHTL